MGCDSLAYWYVRRFHHSFMGRSVALGLDDLRATPFATRLVIEQPSAAEHRRAWSMWDRRSCPDHEQDGGAPSHRLALPPKFWLLQLTRHGTEYGGETGFDG